MMIRAVVVVDRKHTTVVIVRACKDAVEVIRIFLRIYTGVDGVGAAGHCLKHGKHKEVLLCHGDVGKLALCNDLETCLHIII